MLHPVVKLFFIAERFSMRDDCKERSMSFIVVSRTGWPDVGKFAMRDVKLRPTCSSCIMTAPALEACAAKSSLILALAGLRDVGLWWD